MTLSLVLKHHVGDGTDPFSWKGEFFKYPDGRTVTVDDHWRECDRNPKLRAIMDELFLQMCDYERKEGNRLSPEFQAEELRIWSNKRHG